MPRMASAIHDGVSCDSCMKSNFRGDRFKCLRCYDFDLCRECHETSRLAASNAPQHLPDHPMQCMMTQEDFELVYWGETGAAYEDMRIIIFTCPFCGKNGLNHTDLYEHVSQEHPDNHCEVICPLCLAYPSGDPNRVTDYLASHLASEHIVQRQERSREEEMSRGSAHRRQVHRRQMVRGGRPPLQDSSQRSSHLVSRAATTNAAVAAATSATTPNNGADPIAELLTQLSGIRRSNSNYSSTLSQIQLLQQHFERRPGQSSRRERAQRYMPLNYDPTAAEYVAAFEGDPLRGNGPAIVSSSEVPTNSGGAATQQMWSDFVGGAVAAIPMDSAAFAQMLQVAPPPIASTSATIPAVSAVETVKTGAKTETVLAATDSRLLAPRLFAKTTTCEEEEKKFLQQRKEFVANLILSIMDSDELSQLKFEPNEDDMNE